jgi:tRNA-dihydrouridine synthase
MNSADLKKKQPDNSLLKQASKPYFALAPMDDVTDTVFRQIITDCAPPDMFFTEFVNVDAIQSAGRDSTRRRLVFTPKESPLIVQIWGLNPDNFYKTAREVADGSLAKELGLPNGVNFEGIDLNMGCPAKSEVQNGACSALILNKPLAGQIIKATQDGAGSLPVSVKTRLGFNNVDWSWIEFLLEQRLSMLTMHGRTKKQMSKVPADWEAIGHVRELRDKLSPDTLIFGNGDVLSRDQGLALASKYNLDGIMIGRGVFQDPFIFADHSPWSSYSPEDKKNLYKKHITLFTAIWQKNEKKLITLNKFCKIYINGFDGAKELREKLMVAQSAEELLKLLK